MNTKEEKLSDLIEKGANLAIPRGVNQGLTYLLNVDRCEACALGFGLIGMYPEALAFFKDKSGDGQSDADDFPNNNGAMVDLAMLVRGLDGAVHGKSEADKNNPDEENESAYLQPIIFWNDMEQRSWQWIVAKLRELGY